MQITYLFRSPGTGYSIETLFGHIKQTMRLKKSARIQSIDVPHVSKSWWHVWQNLRFVRRLQADVFHITGDIHYTALALPGSQTVLTIHDCGPLKKFRNQPLRYGAFWLLWYYLPVRRARYVTVVSEKTRQELIHYLGKLAEKAVVVANGHDPRMTYAPARFRTERPVLLQIGTASNKNLIRLITALYGIPCTLVIVGPLTDDIRAYLETHQIDYRNYVGLSREALIDCYLDCDMVMFLSTYEGFGMPLLEANAIGRVVLTSALDPMRSIAAEAAHFVDPTDTVAIRQGILQLIEDESYRAQLIEAGINNARRYSIDKTADHYDAIYQKASCITPVAEAIV
ncbi:MULTISPECIES: glycosyltransferase family 1 protein [unclassified Spirosoma]|uniref:glycosyltransferase family 4 protein n=1 Tax=unclassified Spirosoma TaxID=2621999 RepID=UPI0009607809|nr:MULTISPECIES: glycosyltransferase family 1 protein [unclassified Spirosoma]MBN8826814.1 glycosyltransferase family 4 protein [Spirosoma sp.]OJW73614.1 MAG: group 1 glycosyl transferase [Spirosoma sp. 48-14]